MKNYSKWLSTTGDPAYSNTENNTEMIINCNICNDNNEHNITMYMYMYK